MQLSPDGFVAGPEHQMDWMTWNWDDQLKAYVQTITAPVDGILLGRHLAEGFVPAWENALTRPETADAFAHKMVDTPKYIFSKTLNNFTGQNTTLITGDLVEEVTRLKQQPGGDLMLYGGSALAGTLISNRLIDDYYLFVNPAAIGKGLSIFNQLQSYLTLKPADATAFECGIVPCTINLYNKPQKTINHMKKINLTYWILTGLFAFVMLGSAIPDIMVVPMAVQGFKEIGLPATLLPFLGIAKALGVLAILVPGYPRLKEWAYAGLTFDLLGAFYLIIASGKPASNWAAMPVILLLAAAAYWAYHRKLKAISAVTTLNREDLSLA